MMAAPKNTSVELSMAQRNQIEAMSGKKSERHHNNSNNLRNYKEERMFKKMTKSMAPEYDRESSE